jgi:alkylhydroperoxidase/carboxymuconolactone decarboxylase family protein YurZ
MKKFLWIAVFLLLAGCGTTKPAASWLSAGNNQLDNYKRHYLSGQDKIAAIEFNEALREIKKSGDLELLARAHLIRMAMQTAMLQEPVGAEYLKIEAAQSSPANRNFYAFLQGEIAQVDDKLLPRQYLGFIAALKRQDAGERLRAIEKLDDPVSRLIAVGILVRLGQDNEALLQKAIATASAEGWKKALLAYLTRLRAYYEGKQERSKALSIEQRIDLIRD